MFTEIIASGLEYVIDDKVKEIPEVTSFTDIEYSEIESEINIENTIDTVNFPEVQDIRECYEKVDKVLTETETKIEYYKVAGDDLGIDSELRKLKSYKGNILECKIKESLRGDFNEVEETQKSVKTDLGITKPDIVCNDAKEDLKLGNIEIQKGENLYAEVKCGSKDYIVDEMNHIEKQILGHEDGKSAVILTKDYNDISIDKRIEFENNLKLKDSQVVVLDVYAKDIENEVISNIMR